MRQIVVNAGFLGFRRFVLLGLLALGLSLSLNTALAARSATLELALNKVLGSDALKRARIGVYAVDAESREEIFAYNPDEALIPASNNKLFTTAAALDILGPDYRYRTNLVSIGEIKEGVLKGHLMVIGSGDPTISGRFYNGRATAIFEQWADAVAARGIRKVEGYLIGDDDAWTDDDYGPGWDEKQYGEWYCAPSSALSFNDNCVDLIWNPGTGVGQPASYRPEPDTDYLTFDSKVTTRKSGTGAARFYRRQAHSRRVKVTGGVDRNHPGQRDSASVDNPTLYFVTVLAEVLESKGITVEAGPVDIDEFADKSLFRGNHATIAACLSPPLSEIIAVVNKRSQNFYAEQLLRTIGKQVKGSGSYKSGAETVVEFLRKNGISTQGVRMVDGSGLSRDSRATSRSLVQLLALMQRHPQGEVFLDSLPRGNEEDASLEKQFRANRIQQKIAPGIRAKTGRLRGCRALSGYLTTIDSEHVVFSILFNKYSSRRAIQVIEHMVTLLATDGNGGV